MLQTVPARKDATPSSGDDRLTIREAARICSVDYDTFLRWVTKGVLPYVVVGPANRKRVYRRDVERLIRVGR